MIASIAALASRGSEDHFIFIKLEVMFLQTGEQRRELLLACLGQPASLLLQFEPLLLVRYLEVRPVICRASGRRWNANTEFAVVLDHFAARLLDRQVECLPDRSSLPYMLRVDDIITGP